MKTSRNLYDNVEKKLLKLLRVGISTWIISVIQTCLLLYLPIFRDIMYIVYNILLLIGHFSSIRILRATSTDMNTSLKAQQQQQQQQGSNNSHTPDDDAKVTSTPSPTRPLGVPSDTSLDISGNFPLVYNPFYVQSQSSSSTRTTTSSIELESRFTRENILLDPEINISSGQLETMEDIKMSFDVI